METLILALIQLTHQMSVKSSHKVLTEYEALMYEQLCEYVRRFAIILKRGEDEKPDPDQGGST